MVWTLRKPDQKSLEANEATWWAKWAELRWEGDDAYTITSAEFPEYFFNRGGFLECSAASNRAEKLEGYFRSSGRPAVFFVQEGCRDAISSLASRGYAEFERMSVLSLEAAGAPPAGRVTVEEVDERGAASWANAYLEAFGYERPFIAPITRIATALSSDPTVTLLLARMGGTPAGTLALQRTPSMMGAYCVGTIPSQRRAGVASSVLAEAERIASSEGRTLILQTLASDGVEKFYLDRGFTRVYEKVGLRKELGGEVSAAGLGVSMDRGARGYLPFESVFKGFDRVGEVRGIFGSQTDDVLSKLKVDVEDGRGYLHIDDERGCIMVNSKYLQDGPERSVYLDVVHELAHIKQLLDGRELFDRSFKYVDRPTEIEAYVITVREARRLGMNDDEIADYLKVEWVTEEDFKRFLATLSVSPKS